MPIVWIPALMRNLTNGTEQVQIDGKTIRQVVNQLEEMYPGFKTRLCDEDEDRIRPNIAVMVDGRISKMGFLEQVDKDSEIHFLPAISGGV